MTRLGGSVDSATSKELVKLYVAEAYQATQSFMMQWG